MKTKFEISPEIFNGNGSTEECIKYYNEYYKGKGLVLDKYEEEVYKIYDKEIHLIEGDRVLFFGYRIVDWKCFDVENDIITYILRQE